MSTVQQMPTTRKPAPLPQNTVRCLLPPRKAPAKDIGELVTPTAVAQSHHGSILLPYLARVGSDFLEHRPQTSLQRKLAMTLSANGLMKRCVARYGALPKPLTTLLDERVTNVATPAAEVDQIVLTRLNEGGKRLRQDASKAANGSVSVRGTISDFRLVAHSAEALQSAIARLFDQEEAPPPPPARYDFWLDYRGISIYVADEEPWRGGVDPYFQAEFFTIPPGSSASASVIPPLAVTQSPQDLYACGEGFWYPNGGASDSGWPNWIYPIYYTADGPVFPGIMWPPLSENDAHFCTIQVWESDDRSLPECMATVSGALMALGTGAAFGSPHLGIVLVTLAALSEVVAWLSGGDDDYVGGVCLLFDKEDLEYPYDQSIGARVQATENSNDWELYFGVRSRRIAD